MTESNTDDDGVWRVPVIDPEGGGEWDEMVEADGPMEAIRNAPDGVHIDATFVDRHLDVEVPPADEETEDV